MGAAMALSISSTAVVLRILEQKREMHSVPGRLTFGVLLIQDLVAVALMGLLPPLAAWAGAKSAPADSTIPAPVRVLGEGLVAVGGIGVMIGIGRVLLPRMLRAAAGSAEVLLVVSAAIALGAAVATKYLGFSPELGGFLAGFLLSSTPFRFQLSGQLLPMRDLFLAVFFTAVGLELPLAAVADAWWAVLLAVAVVITVKGVTIGLTAWAAGASASVAAYTGLAIAQASEFSLVIVKQANEQGVMDDARQGYGIAVVVLTMVVTPGLFQLAHRAAERAVRLPPAPWIKRSALRGSHTAAAGGHPDAAAAPNIGSAIIAGFGPVGRAVADALEKRNVKVTIVELNPRTVERQYSLGRSIVYGDVANPEVMERAGISGADAVILTVPDEDAVLRACRLVRMRRPDIFIAARVNALSKAMQALQLGADHTVVEEMATAEAMANQVLLKLADRAEGKDTGPRLYEFSS
jgi:CPA2 family monovalent cation:H+ antiporter-2